MLKELYLKGMSTFQKKGAFTLSLLLTPVSADGC